MSGPDEGRERWDRIPDPPSKTYSVNEAYFDRWFPGQQRLVSHMKREARFGSRYIGSFVADVHRTLLRGGLFMYPADRHQPEGKLRLLYEAAPMAMIVEQAGGGSSDGSGSLLAIEPTDLHQRIPVYLGSAPFVAMAEDFLARDVKI